MKKYDKKQWRLIRQWSNEGYSYDEIRGLFSKEFPSITPPQNATISRRIAYYNEGLAEAQENAQFFSEGYQKRKYIIQRNKQLLEITSLSLIKEFVKKYEPIKINIINQKKETKEKPNRMILFGDMQETGNRKCFNVFNKVLEVVEKEKTKTLNIFDLGDQVEGILRTSSLYSMPENSGIVKQVLIYIDVLKNFFQKLLEKGFNINFYMLSSNHTQIRLQALKANENPDEDIGYFIFEALKNAFSNYIKEKKFKIVFDHLIVYKKENIKILLVHGQYIKKSLNAYYNYFLQEHIKYKQDYLVHGHFHNYEYKNVDKGGILSVPALHSNIPKGKRFKYNHRAGFLIWEISKNINKIEYYAINS